MPCSESLKTKSGTFTFYDEKLTKCEAELKCMKMGQLLAPVSNKRDAKKILKFFENNIDITCSISPWDAYWIGLDTTFNGTMREKVFSNGIKWNDKKHSKIYNKVYKNEDGNCPVAYVLPMIDEDPFVYGDESLKCDIRMKRKYFCLKPAGEATAESINQDSTKNAVTLLSGFLAATVFMFVAVVIVAVRLHSKNRRLVEENINLKKIQADI